MRNRKISESKSFLKSLNSYFQYKEKTMEDKAHAYRKYNEIIEIIINISQLKTFPCKKVNYGRSSDMQYFEFQKHTILFKLTETEMQLKYFIASKRIKKTL